jgi:hypothetical protein
MGERAAYLVEHVFPPGEPTEGVCRVFSLDIRPTVSDEIQMTCDSHVPIHPCRVRTALFLIVSVMTATIAPSSAQA